MPVTAAGAFRLESVKLTSADGTGYSGDLLQGVAAGTLVTQLLVATASTATATPQGPNGTQRVAVYLHNSSGTTYYEVANFNLRNDPDAVQWTWSPTDLVLPSTAWKFCMAITRSGLPAGCELVLTGWARDVA